MPDRRRIRMIVRMPQPRLDRYVVKPTDLNRRSGEILERAGRYPVLIARADDPLILARHEWVSTLLGSEARADLLAELSGYLTRRLTGAGGDEGGSFDWLNAFGDTEVREFVSELRAAIRDAQASAIEPDVVDAIVHEWHESAIRPREYVRTLKRTAPIRRR